MENNFKRQPALSNLPLPIRAILLLLTFIIKVVILFFALPCVIVIGLAFMLRELIIELRK